MVGSLESASNKTCRVDPLDNITASRLADYLAGFCDQGNGGFSMPRLFYPRSASLQDQRLVRVRKIDQRPASAQGLRIHQLGIKRSLTRGLRPGKYFMIPPR